MSRGKHSSRALSPEQIIAQTEKKASQLKAGKNAAKSLAAAAVVGALTLPVSAPAFAATNDTTQASVGQTTEAKISAKDLEEAKAKKLEQEAKEKAEAEKLEAEKLEAEKKAKAKLEAEKKAAEEKAEAAAEAKAKKEAEAQAAAIAKAKAEKAEKEAAEKAEAEAEKKSLAKARTLAAAEAEAEPTPEPTESPVPSESAEPTKPAEPSESAEPTEPTESEDPNQDLADEFSWTVTDSADFYNPVASYDIKTNGGGDIQVDVVDPNGRNVHNANAGGGGKENPLSLSNTFSLADNDEYHPPLGTYTITVTVNGTTEQRSIRLTKATSSITAPAEVNAGDDIVVNGKNLGRLNYSGYWSVTGGGVTQNSGNYVAAADGTASWSIPTDPNITEPVTIEISAGAYPGERPTTSVTILPVKQEITYDWKISDTVDFYNPEVTWSLSSKQAEETGYSLNVTDTDGNVVYTSSGSTISGGESFTIDNAKLGTYTAALTVDGKTETRSIKVVKEEAALSGPTRIKAGDSLTVDGKNFYRNQQVQWSFNDPINPQSGTVTSDENGNISIDLLTSADIPSDVTLTLTVTVNGETYTHKVEVESIIPTFSVPSKVTQGDSINFSGENYTPYALYRVVGSNGESTTVMADGNGNISGQIRTDDNFVGNVTLVILEGFSDNKLGEGVTEVVLGWTDANFNLSSNRVQKGESIDITGEGYKPNTRVVISVNGRLYEVDVRNSGGFRHTISVDDSYGVGSYTITVTGSNAQGTADFTVYEEVKPPVDPTDPPVDPTDPPVDPTDPPVKPTDPPVDPTDPPVKPTDPPTGPVDPTDPPVGPIDPTDPPVGPVDPNPIDPVLPPVNPNPNPGPIVTDPDGDGGDGGDGDKVEDDLTPEQIEIIDDNERNENTNQSLVIDGEEVDRVEDVTVSPEAGGVQDAYGSVIIPDSDSDGNDSLPTEDDEDSGTLPSEDDFESESPSPSAEEDESNQTIAIQSSERSGGSGFMGWLWGGVTAAAAGIVGFFAWLLLGAKRRKDEEGETL